MKKLLIIGSEGYVGPSVINEFKDDFEITCFDSNWFVESKLNFLSQASNITKIHGDVRSGIPDILTNKSFDVVIFLAAVSNDPIGHMFATPTHQINTDSALNIAKYCKKNGVKQFLYASSCSVYGNGNGVIPVDELTKVNPLTDYSISKYNAEKGLNKLSSKDFKIGCLRFATAAGPSINMRYDLVVNDFIISALKTGEIIIKSNGKPWRPIINTIDMAAGFRNFFRKLDSSPEEFLVLNVGFNDWNFTVEEIAQNVKNVIGEKINIQIDKNAPEDKRSYRVNFDWYSNIDTDQIVPKASFSEMINETINITEKIISLNSSGFYLEHLMKRHSTLNNHIANNKMNSDLIWIKI